MAEVKDSTPNELHEGDDAMMYRCLVVDSGPIIRMTGLTALRDKAKLYYTVPAVMQEIRDAKAREHLGSLPFQLMTREASPEGIQAMVNFSRQTGDYQSLSNVDLQILGLLYDLGELSPRYWLK
jgi:RNA-binding protein NOB1